MILAAWYKRALKESLLGKIYANRSKLRGVDQDPKNNQVIYQRYLQAYKKGVFNFIKEDVDRYTNETIPKQPKRCQRPIKELGSLPARRC